MGWAPNSEIRRPDGAKISSETQSFWQGNDWQGNVASPIPLPVISLPLLQRGSAKEGRAPFDFGPGRAFGNRISDFFRTSDFGVRISEGR